MRILLFLCFSFFLAIAVAMNDTKAYTSADTDGLQDGDGNDKVNIRSITALTFSETGRARTRNGKRRQELVCKGGSASHFWWFADYYPHQVECRNAGFDGISVQWSCLGSLDKTVEFGAETSVDCEPYEEGVNDGYILSGSCRLLYTLNFKTFRITYIHIAYGSVLIMILLWAYLQTRFWARRYLKRQEARRKLAAQTDITRSGPFWRSLAEAAGL